jgi:hypothetical protein
MLGAEYSLLEISARRWQAKQVLANVLGTQVEMLRLALEHSSLNWRVGDLLDQVRETLEGVIGSRTGHLIHADSIGALNGLLAKVAPEHSVSVGTVRTLLGRLHSG